MSRISLVLTLALIILIESSVRSECFRGRPSPECKSFWITESAAYFPLDDRGRKDYIRRGYYLLEIGRMYNLPDRFAIGATLSTGYNDGYEDFRLLAGLRIRRWMSRRLGVDLSMGAILKQGSSMGEGSGDTPPAPYLQTVVMYGDLIGITARAELYRSKYTGVERVDCYGGLKFGSEPGVAIGAAGVVGFAVGICIALSNWNMGS